MTRKRKARELDEGTCGVSDAGTGQEACGVNMAVSRVWMQDKTQEEAVDDQGLVTLNDPPQLAKAESGGQKRRKYLSNAACLKKISLECEWNMCTATYNKMESFISHIADHLAAETTAPTGDGYLCYWRECGSVCNTKEELDRHVFFHAFHTKTKSIGTLLMKENTEQCSLDSSGRNMIPEIPEAFQCMWEDCALHFASAQNFYWHILSHVRSTDRTPKTEFYHCAWEGCTSQFRQNVRLTDHARSHTQEKIVGCPNCGGIYASNTKFFDHCIRQIPLDSQQFQCSHCSRRYANERLLRDHVRHHINHYKCSQCDMTVPNKSTLASHIRYRHSNYRPHKCPQCKRGFTSITDLSRHMTIHSDEPAYVCPYQECDYKCRSNSTLNRHIRTEHNGLCKKHYMCHMCEDKFSNGESLTKHLIKEHSFLSPVGHTRFRYKQDEDGFYRLQTIRYESIEPTQGMEDEGVGTGEENIEALQDMPSSLSSVASSLPPKEFSQKDTWDNQDPYRLLSRKQKQNSKFKTQEFQMTQEILLPSEF